MLLGFGLIFTDPGSKLSCVKKPLKKSFLYVHIDWLVFNATFNNIVLLCVGQVLLVEAAGRSDRK